MLGGDITPKDYCEPCAQKYVEISRARGCGAEITLITPSALSEPAAHASDAVRRLREAIVAERGNGAATYVAGDTRRDTDTDAAIAAVEQELVQLLRDRERLDWLAAHGRPIELLGTEDKVGLHYGLVAAPEVSLREAIDTMRAAETAHA